MGSSSSKNKNLTISIKIQTQNDIYEVLAKINSNINGLFSKTTVTQTFRNPSDSPLELKIYIFKKINIIFSSFECQIGDSIKVKSKVIKEEKAQEKYSDSIASGNAAIFVSQDPKDENKIIVHMGNIPPKTDVIFISNFISPIESSNNKYEFEMFRNLPIFHGGGKIYQNSKIEGEININSNYKIKNIEKNILMKDLTITEEKLSSKSPYFYLLKYEIKNLPNKNYNNNDYISSSKLYFDLDNDQPLILMQESNKITDEKYYYIQYQFKNEQVILNKEYQEISPSLYIFLLDQSGSMSGQSIKIASKALLIFLQSIPAGSYYQIIGFGSIFIKYDKVPKEYNKENIKNSINLIQNLNADLGGTDIYNPLKDIFDSNDYDNINLPRNIFLLTDGEVLDKNDVLNLIDKNNSKFRIYSIGIGSDFDEDLIKNAGIIGKGNYNFCKDINLLGSVIVSEIEQCSNLWMTDIKIECDIKNNKIHNNIPKNIRENEFINLYYINDDIINEKIKLEIKYKDNKNKEYKKDYEIISQRIENGDVLSKLIINNYIKNNNNLTQEEKIKLSLKYQILIKGTSLFAEVELNGKISESMKSRSLGKKDAKNPPNTLQPLNNNNMLVLIANGPFDQNLNPYEIPINLNQQSPTSVPDDPFGGPTLKPVLIAYEPFDQNLNPYEIPITLNQQSPTSVPNDPFGGHTISDPFEISNLNDTPITENSFNPPPDSSKLEFSPDKNPYQSNSNNNFDNTFKKKDNFKGEKDELMEMINTQDFIEGFWEENEYTKKIIEKYEKEYKLIKGLKDKNFDDKIIITILIIYFINKEHSSKIKDLLMIIKKAKIYIKKTINDTYENIIKEVNIN